MKFPSILNLYEKSLATVSRFPFVLTSAIAGSLFLIRFNELPNDALSMKEASLKLALTFSLALPLFLSLTMYGEKQNWKRGKIYLANVVASVLLIGYFFSIGDVNGIHTVIRFVQYAIGTHLLVSILPYLGRREFNGFWQYNKALMIRILTSAIYSLVLFLGMALALLAIDNLFEAHIDSKNYFRLWVVVAGIFNTWFFLAGMPSDYQALQQNNEYPKGLKVFTQYVLLPLVILYLGILYSYEVKIFVTQHWPVGWVAYLVICFCIAGIFSLLLIWPLKEGEGNTWIKSFSNFFYVALLPLIVLLLLAIKKRVDDYGITENRYFVIVLAFWLVFISAYFLLSKLKNIKVIPMSLCSLAFLTSFGPWGAFSVSLKSQANHLSEVVQRNKMLADGKIIKAQDEIAFNDQREISSIIEYMVTVHGYQSLQPFFSQDLDSLIQQDSMLNQHQKVDDVKQILELINITYIQEIRANDFDEKFIDFRSSSDSSISISGYQYFISDYSVNKDETIDSVCSSYLISDKSINICFNSKKGLISISENRDSMILFNVPLLISRLKENKYANNRLLNAAEMTLVSGNEHFRVCMIFKSIFGAYEADSVRVKRLEADIFIQIKELNEHEKEEKYP